MNWIMLAILSAFTGALSRVLQKALLKEEQSDPFAFGFIFQLLVAGLFLIYTLITRSFEFPNLADVAINLGIMAVFYSLANLCVFKAFKYAEASEVSILFASSTVWSVLSAVIFLNERLTMKNIGGIALIILGVIAINYTRTQWKLNRGHICALLAACLFGFAFTNDAYILNHYHSIPSYMIIAFALPGILTLFYSPTSARKVQHFIYLDLLKKLLACCILYAISAITIFTAYKLGGQASLISPIQQVSIIFTVVLSYFILHEKQRMLGKVMGTLLAFGGVLLLL